jgi:hypothetical protein
MEGNSIYTGSAPRELSIMNVLLQDGDGLMHMVHKQGNISKA